MEQNKPPTRGIIYYVTEKKTTQKAHMLRVFITAARTIVISDRCERRTLRELQKKFLRVSSRNHG